MLNIIPLPTIPFHKLQTFHKEIEHKIKFQESGYFDFHKKYLMQLITQKISTGLDSMYQTKRMSKL